MESKKFSVQDLVEQVAAQSSLTKKFTEEFLKELVSVIEEYLEKEGVVKVKGLGTFKLIWNEERKSVNVTTGEELILPAHYKVSFTAESSVLDRLNGVASSEVAAAPPFTQPTEPSTPDVSLSVAASTSTPAQSASSAEEPAKPAQELPKPFFIPVPGKEQPAEEASVSSQTAEPPVVPLTGSDIPQPAPAEASASESHPQSEVEAPLDIVEPNAPESKEDDFQMQRVKKKGHGWIWWLLILALLAGAGWYFRDLWYPQARGWIDTYLPTHGETVVPSDTLEVEQSVFAEGDSIALDDDSTSIAEEYEGEIPIETEQKAESQEERRQRLLSEYTPDVAQNAPVRESVIVIDGSRLTLFALRAYGHKDFWVYIYDANRDVLTSPGSLAKGMSLKIPDLDNLLVDPDNADCLQKASQLAAQY